MQAGENTHQGHNIKLNISFIQNRQSSKYMLKNFFSVNYAFIKLPHNFDQFL